MDQTERMAWLMEHSHHGTDFDAAVRLLEENERMRNALKMLANPKNWNVWRNPDNQERTTYEWKWSEAPYEIAQRGLSGE